MDRNIFNPAYQHSDISSKIVAGLERIAEVFKVLLWEKAKSAGLSPIQIQILIFVAYHQQSLCTVSQLAKEFNITKPTVSDAVKVLLKKALIEKDYSEADNRSYSIKLTESGKSVVKETSDFANPLKKQIDKLDKEESDNLFGSISELIYRLNRSGILDVQRICYGCSFYQKNKTHDYCNLLQKELLIKDIRIDCPEYNEKDSA